MRYLLKITISGILLSFLLKASLSSQVLNDSATYNLIKKGVEYIYNCEFDKATAVYEKLKSGYPEHPMPYLFNGMITYWRYFPLIPTSPIVSSFEQNMYKCIELCEKIPDPSYEPEYALSELGARGLLLLYYADNDLSMSVISIAAKTYQLVTRAFDLTDSYDDFYFITGLYNYYREAYPESHPVYKPFAILFPRGDKVKGLKELSQAARYAIFLKAEAYTFLSGIYISFENNYPTALAYSKNLYRQYPNNNQFLSVYIKNILLMKRYDEAEKLLGQNKNPESFYFRFQKNIFKGILYEKKYHNSYLAETFYKAGIKQAETIGDFANEYLAYAYFGLSRIMKTKNENKLSKSYYKKAMDLAAFKNVNFN
ncbi:MAG: hypothetical protein JXK95_08765 [Bacteroidales bacterium]|nr:hypothetical protein [Bacteroidales bacterium]